jgi:hypothetical protein
MGCYKGGHIQGGRLVPPGKDPPREGELVCAFAGEYAPEHQIVHLELPIMHELLVIAFERLTVPHISKSYLPSSLVDVVDIITPKLVLREFVICLDTAGGHGDLQGDNGRNPVYQEEECLPCGMT